jgi:hypothetical protein
MYLSFKMAVSQWFRGALQPPKDTIEVSLEYLTLILKFRERKQGQREEIPIYIGQV